MVVAVMTGLFIGLISVYSVAPESVSTPQIIFQWHTRWLLYT